MSILKNKIFLSAFSSLGSNLLLRSLSIITIPIFTRILSPEDFGIVSNFTAFYTVLSVIASLSLSTSIGVAYTLYKHRLKEYLYSILVLYSTFFLIIIIATVPFYYRIEEELNLTKEMLFFLGLCVLFIPIFDIIIEYLRFDYQYKLNTFLSVFISVSGVLMSLIFVNFFDMGYSGRILGIYLPTLILGISYYFKTIKAGFHPNIISDWKFALRISLPMIPHALGMVVFTQIDRILISDLDSFHNAGIYSFAVTYASIIQIFSNALMISFVPWLYKAFKDNKFFEIDFFSNLLILALAVVIFGAISFAPEILFLLGGDKFVTAKSVSFYLCLATFFQLVYTLYSSIELYLEKTYLIAVGTVLVALISYSFNYLLIPFYGFHISALVSLVSYFLLAVAHWLILNRLVQRRLFSLKNSLKIFLGLILFSSVSFFMLNNLLFRILFFLVILLLVYFVKVRVVLKSYM